MDFLLELDGKTVPIEIKSGKDYMRHVALSKLLSIGEYGITESFVMAQCNIRKEPGITYLPIYMISFFRKPEIPENLIYHLDMSDIAVPTSTFTF